MAFTDSFTLPEPLRSEVDALPAVVLEFGTGWCGFCRGVQPLIAGAFAEHAGGDDIRHIKIEDGSGRPLGRSFRVKLWPTLIVLKNGAEVARVVRPQRQEDVAQALAQLDAA
ncbi:MAG: thioredoxin family protein [Polaromonas sp.]|nr:thioredoxin family protein [Polaromonas sp.]